jgi:hypothetical protein
MKSKCILVDDLVEMAHMEGFTHSIRFNRRNVKALSPDEMPGYRLKKFMEHDPVRAPLIKELKEEDFNHRFI